MQKKIQILYIAGCGRNGSTILGNILGQIPDFFFGGEIRHIWDRGMIKNRRCGCGANFGDCELWSNVLANAFGVLPNIDAKEMARLREAALRTRHLLVRDASKLIVDLNMNFTAYLENVKCLYDSIRVTSGCSVIIDTSKYPSHAFMLNILPEIDLRVVHLVRDPRASVYSWWNRKKLNPDRGDKHYMRRQNPLMSTLVWIEWNHVIRNHWGDNQNSYIRVRYEDFAQSPADTVRNIVSTLYEKGADLDFLDRDIVFLERNHSFSGNPVRFSHGSLQIKEDNEWRVSMPMWQRILVTSMALPWLRRYGYPLLGV